ncbi:MAG: hypothetical protein L0Y58_22210 [Verrucomicrobia subdivision 3 bacterium]|nr:hypothetical protein [Limisphaerales bacterium]
MAETARADLIAQWTFNSTSDDTNVATGATLPSFGIGNASLIGGVTAIFATGSPSDPATNDNSGWNTRTYAPQGSDNKARGVEFRVSTEGFESIMVSWAQRNSSTASRYVRFQWSSDGTNFVDGMVVSNSVQETYFDYTADLNSIPALNNNANFSFRLVAEFESTAIGAGATQYVATASGSSYATAGTLRYDMVTISGSVFSGNAFPTITPIANQIIPINSVTDQLPFTVGDVETPPEGLIVTAESSNPVLVPVDNIVIEGNAANRSVTILPAFGQSGSATITLRVTDGDGKSGSTSFVLTVTPGDTPPIISAFTNYYTVINTSFAPAAFSINDAQTAAENLMLSVASSNPTLIPEANVLITGNSTNRILQVTPAPEQTGNAVITVTVSDGTFSSSRSFSMMVLPSSSVLLCDDFTYPDGSVVTNSGLLWNTYSGIFGQSRVSGGELWLTEDNTEDINALLIGAPHHPSNSAVLYVSFNATFLEMPEATGAYFALFREMGQTYRGRLFAATLRSESGFFGLGIANVTGNVTNVAFLSTNLILSTKYLVVMRYNVKTGESALWVNPASESEPAAIATDATDPETIYSFAFRQNNGFGQVRVDNLKVALSFADVVPGYRLSAVPISGQIEISWPATASDEGYQLHVSSGLSPANWTPLGAVPMRNNSRDSVRITPGPGAALYRLRKP